MDALRDHRRNDRRHDLVDRRVRCNVSHRDRRVMVDRRVNRKSDLRDVDHRLPLDDRHQMGCLYVDDLMMVVTTYVSRGHHMSDLLDDQNLVVNLLNRNCALRDRKTDENLDVNHDPRMNDRLDDHLMDDVRHGLNLGASRANRNYVRRDRKTDENLNVNRDRHRSDLLDDHLMDDDHHDALDGHHKNVMDDPSLGGTTDASLCLRMNGTDDRN